jgi:hypothetical protein
VYFSAIRRYQLAPGERGVFMVIAADRRQGRVVKRYINGFLHAHRSLAALVIAERADAIELSTGVTIEIHTASFRAVRGYTVVGAILDEIAFFRNDEAANPDVEILNALRPAMATVPSALLLAISSPYARRGELWRAYADHFGHDDDPILVLQADTRTMHARVPQHIIDTAYADDEARASAEYGAQSRTDLEKFVTIEALEAVTIKGRTELTPQYETSYVAFVDPSGGSSDSMTLAISHRDRNGRAVLDRVLEKKPPFNPETVVSDFADLLKPFRVRDVHGDRYGGEWPRQVFHRHGIAYRVSDDTKSDLYLATLPILRAGKAELLDDERLRLQFLALERRTTRNGRDIVDHPPGRHDDLANSVAGALVRAAAESRDQFGRCRSRWLQADE